MRRKIIAVSLSVDRQALLEKMMREDIEDNTSHYISSLIVKEHKRREEDKSRRAPGRPKKGEADADSDELPDENEPRTMKVPLDLLKYVHPLEKKKLVNAFDLEMIRARKERADAQ